MQPIKTFLMFQGNAEEAMNFYISLFPDSSVGEVTRYGAQGPGREGTIVLARFTLHGQEYMCIDSYMEHAFTFTPSMSLYVSCRTEEEIDHLFGSLSAGGQVLMPLAPYPFSRKFGWTADRFGVSWQVNLES